MSLPNWFREELKHRGGSMPVADYMALCLGHPEHGYYITRDPFGKTGDFTTAPEISQVFGELIGAWCADIWQQMKQPSLFTPMELGPGRGTLMRDALRATKNVPGFHAAIQLELLETSPILRKTQLENLRDYKPKHRTDLNDLPAQPLIVIANEFFDALPVRQVAGGATRCVRLNNNQLEFYPEGPITEHHDTGCAIMSALTRHITHFGGALLAIDYGYVGAAVGDTLQAVKNHAYAHPLEQPGTCDLTCHVDFAQLANAAQKEGGRVFGPVTQGAFLKALGITARTEILCKNADAHNAHLLKSATARLTETEQMGDLFKVLAVCSEALVAAGTEMAA